MKPASTYATDRNFALLLIGPPKSGKTTLSLAFPGLAILDCDRNLAGPMRFTGYSDFLYHDPNEVPEEKRWENCVTFLREACAEPKVETIVIDGLSHLSEYLIRAILANTKMDSARQRGGGELIVAGEPVMQMSYWGPFRNKLYQFIAAGRSSGKRLIVTCHELIMTDEKSGGVVAYRPLIPGQLRENLAGMFSDVWRTELSTIGNKTDFKVRFAPRNLMQIGNSLNIKDPELILTNKTPRDVWSSLSRYFT
jgi:hypothetical protein